MKPYSLIQKSLALLCLFCFLSSISCQTKTHPEENIKVLLTEVNMLRTKGCQCGADWMPPARLLTWNKALEKAARNHASDMAVRNYFDHISPEGTSPIQRAVQAGYTGTYVGENIARGYSTIHQVIEAWKASESHCKTIMDTLYTEMGVSKNGVYWVQELGRP